jgi:hypothetical protein
VKRYELLRQVRSQLNRLAVELVEDDSLEAAQNCIAASMLASSAQDNLADKGEDETETAADLPAQEG